MADESICLPAVRRVTVGATAAAVRKSGYVPAVLYGHGTENHALAVDAKVFMKTLPQISSSTLLTLAIEGDEPRRVLVPEVQHHPLTGLPVHVDFHQVALTEKIRAKVPLKPVGVSTAVNDLGGILVQSLAEIEVEALPIALPSEIPVDLSRLAAFDDRITVADLVIPAGVTVHARPEEIVAVVTPPRTEEELKAELETPTTVAPAAEVKTEAEVKKAAEEAQKVVEEQTAEVEKKTEAKKGQKP